MVTARHAPLPARIGYVQVPWAMHAACVSWAYNSSGRLIGSSAAAAVGHTHRVALVQSQSRLLQAAATACPSVCSTR
jgi:hypothetical protein